jgi:hypothetical protein
MAEQIVLSGGFDFERTYEFLKSFCETESITDIQKGGFTVRYKGLKDVNVQFYDTGTVIINGDDYSDPADLIRLAEQGLCRSDQTPVKLILRTWRIRSIDAEWFVRAFLLRELNALSAESLELFNREVHWQLARLRRVFQMTAHSTADELLAGRREYHRTLNELGLLPQTTEPLDQGLGQLGASEHKGCQT